MIDGKEFWDGEKTLNIIEQREYFANQLPADLNHFKNDPLVMSAFGALTFYLTQVWDLLMMKWNIDHMSQM